MAPWTQVYQPLRTYADRPEVYAAAEDYRNWAVARLPYATAMAARNYDVGLIRERLTFDDPLGGDLQGLRVAEFAARGSFFAPYALSLGADHAVASDNFLLWDDMGGRDLWEFLWHRAAGNAAGRLHMSDDDMRALPYPDGSFDVVASLCAVEHVQEGWKPACAELGRVTAPGGLLVISLEMGEVFEWVAGSWRFTEDVLVNELAPATGCVLDAEYDLDFAHAEGPALTAEWDPHRVMTMSAILFLRKPK